MIILGNPKVLSRQPLWNNLLNHYKSHSCLVDGSLTNLKPANIKLEKARRYLNKRNALIPVAYNVNNGSTSNANGSTVTDPVMESQRRSEAINRLSYGFIDEQVDTQRDIELRARWRPTARNSRRMTPPVQRVRAMRAAKRLRLPVRINPRRRRSELAIAEFRFDNNTSSRRCRLSQSTWWRQSGAKFSSSESQLELDDLSFGEVSQSQFDQSQQSQESNYRSRQT